ncbi:MAG: type IV toxin-antitoxin system AbiEi family antitoxin domain-containing protein [Actinomycetota bacterium]
MGAGDLDRLIAKLATRQHGAFTHRQAVCVGASRAQIRTRVAKGCWTVVFRGTYVIAGSPDTFKQRATIAMLVSAPGAAVSSLAAAHLLQIIDEAPSLIDVTVPHDAHHPRRPRVRVHRAKSLDPAAALDAALDLGLLSVRSLLRYLGDRSLWTCRGAARLRRLLHDRSKGVPGSELERVFLRLLRKERLPEPRRQYKVGSRRIDFAYIDQRVAIELDGLGPHRKKKTFVDDRRRQNSLVLDGWTILRFTWEDLSDRPDDVVSIVTRALSGPRRLRD